MVIISFLIILHHEHLQFCPSTIIHLSSGNLTLSLATFLPLSVPMLPEQGHLTQGGALDLGLGQQTYHASLASVLHLKMDMQLKL